VVVTVPGVRAYMTELGVYSQRKKEEKEREAPAIFNYPLLGLRPTCCENTEQGLQPFLICKHETTLQRPLAILRRQMRALCDFAVMCGPQRLPMHEGLQNLTKFKTTGGPH